jgi:SAM-dependent methyltransferase
VASDYDSFAEAYAAETESSLLNGYYARPAILDLAGEVAGRRILDVGCGAGPLLAALRNRGAIVTGVDPSARMLELARQPFPAWHFRYVGGLPHADPRTERRLRDQHHRRHRGDPAAAAEPRSPRTRRAKCPALHCSEQARRSAGQHPAGTRSHCDGGASSEEGGLHRG